MLCFSLEFFFIFLFFFFLDFSLTNIHFNNPKIEKLEKRSRFCKISIIYKTLQWLRLIQSNGLSPLEKSERKCVLAQKWFWPFWKSLEKSKKMRMSHKDRSLQAKNRSLAWNPRCSYLENLEKAITKRKGSILTLEGSILEGIFSEDSFCSFSLKFLSYLHPRIDPYWSKDRSL